MPMMAFLRFEMLYPYTPAIEVTIEVSMLVRQCIGTQKSLSEQLHYTIYPSDIPTFSSGN